MGRSNEVVAMSFLLVVAKEAGLSHDMLCSAWPASLYHLRQQARQHSLVLGAHQAVVEHAQALVVPQTQELGRSAELV